jgi:SAM-dependent methyltransferase
MLSAEAEARLLESYTNRRVSEWIPRLPWLLRPGMNVLDVGCGSGGITIDVARRISPGKITGVDPGTARIGIARKLAERDKVGNVSFVIGDAHSLDFEDNCFDLVYSNTVLHSLIDPVAVLMEQKRVTRAGGHVIAAGVRDWGVGARYPVCPNLDKLERAWVAYYQNEYDRYQRGERPAVLADRALPECAYFNLYAGRKCAEWFTSAGLEQFKIEATVFRLDHAGREEMNPGGFDLLPWTRDGETPWNEVFPDLLSGGYIDSETVDAALKEAEEWYKNPNAFNLWVYLYVEAVVQK